ncbi:hypothetical protein BO78DRAFT_442659 [Aspergillus sclerotiicarbonarius CBS 121057]|uniref:MYND-type domain-containing protein n=1 Tax=Aspergillus sclerotiicarbonarius (strain CBS 121057 / IBT 28362) TaxID=1448318 RepID=A0A319EM22_ASPSB|nr:hypothetical protein BO78DRAFT_442659 [Aspergillus sclerotiicarbonarius CBS 121057]
MAFKTLPSGCGVCGKMKNLKRCSECNVVPYCSTEHKALDHPNHKIPCELIQSYRDDLEPLEEDSDSSGESGSYSDDSDAEWYIGGSLIPTPLARIRVLPDIYHVESVVAQLDNSFDILGNCMHMTHCKNSRIPQQVPQLMLRLGRDEDCYGFVKHATKKEGDLCRNEHCSHTLLLDYPRNDNPFEPLNYSDEKFLDPSHTIALTLLKVRLLLDLRRMEECEVAVGPKVPTEILFMIQSYVPFSSIVSNSKEFLKSKARREKIKTLDIQIEDLYKRVKKDDKNFWVLLVGPDSRQVADVDPCPKGRWWMRILLNENSVSWAETPGAIDVIKAKVARDNMGF